MTPIRGPDRGGSAGSGGGSGRVSGANGQTSRALPSSTSYIHPGSSVLSTHASQPATLMSTPPQPGRSQCNTLTRSNNPRPPYLAATDYVFYVRRQTAACQAARKNADGVHEASMEELTNFTDLMRKLKDDLKSSYSSFVEEFVTDPNDGVALLLDLLKIYRRGNQQEHLGHPLTLRNNKDRQQIIKKNMSEELDCIECIFYTLRCKKSLSKLIAHGGGMTSIASSVMSSCTVTRKFALQLMSRVIEEHPLGYQKVMDSISAVRVIHGETVRFKFLVSMLLNRSKMATGFELAALYFFNCVHIYTPSASDKVRIQNELDEVGFDITALEKNLIEKGFPSQDPVWEEVRRWKDNFLNVDHALAERKKIKSENSKLRTELELLRRALKRLEVDKISLMGIEKELKERCKGLELEVNALKKSVPVASKSSSAKSSDTEDSDHSDNTQGTNDSGRSSFKDYSHRKSRVSLRAGASTSSNSTAASPTAPSPDTQQVGHTTHQRQLSDSGDEAIDILQIPTIRPPEGFTTDCPVDPEHNVSQDSSKAAVIGYVEKVSEGPLVVTVGRASTSTNDSCFNNKISIGSNSNLKGASNVSKATTPVEAVSSGGPELLEWNYPIIPEPRVLSSSRPVSRASRAHSSATFSVASSSVASNARTMSIISNC
ncbi:uncharacterized protein LOC111268703 isoform X1 [Varroa jacobsoni]|nr:uncharacterized protein LOC111248224 isoform X3 [Varroa destructor]XP_022655903.1 uncharacterized protein LOC111248224 isoform X3 [Varroa destructor]XP_022655904.1 uncharacterized protein LOC111248224 isoform X3 [Varroa destructor]XP_022655905.1 uncharacterized protein LOC111248224 isoform X3 [Varroa destructor]XP_022703580.1 uncharacterized protein LOC111268703 isoform X1 [Varroa jacobsoni]XP_022703581.1 uncharacterized protein LOC111268703 isoform X1 [Varroa jacobsoni]XP_022703582.1 unch